MQRCITALQTSPYPPCMSIFFLIYFHLHDMPDPPTLLTDDCQKSRCSCFVATCRACGRLLVSKVAHVEKVTAVRCGLLQWKVCSTLIGQSMTPYVTRQPVCLQFGVLEATAGQSEAILWTCAKEASHFFPTTSTSMFSF